MRGWSEVRLPATIGHAVLEHRGKESINKQQFLLKDCAQPYCY